MSHASGVTVRLVTTARIDKVQCGRAPVSAVIYCHAGINTLSLTHFPLSYLPGGCDKGGKYVRWKSYVDVVCVRD